MKNKYKVVHVMLSTYKGTVEETFRHYNLALNEFCSIISVISSKCQNKQFFTEGSDEVVELNQRFGVLSSALHLRKIISESKADLVIAHGTMPLMISSVASLGLKIRRITVRHTFFDSGFAALKWRLQSDVNIAVNKKLASYLGDNKTHLIYNAVPCDLPDGLDFEEKIWNLNRPIRIGFLGRIDRSKGAQFLVKALGLLKVKGNFELRIGGEGSYMRALKNLIFLYGLNDDVKIFGYVENKSKFFNDIDILCMPSLKEPFSLVLIEGMAHGVPVIASNVPGMDEVIRHDENGLLFNCGDHYSLAHQIEALAFDDEKRKRLTKQGFEDVKNLYTIHRLREDLRRVIIQTLN